MKLPHAHVFHPRISWRSGWGLTGWCRCGLGKRRMFGGMGYAREGDHWWYDRPGGAE